MDICETNLSYRAYNCLRRAGIQTVEQLKELSHDDLCRIPNLSQKNLKEIEEKIKNF